MQINLCWVVGSTDHRYQDQDESEYGFDGVLMTKSAKIKMPENLWQLLRRYDSGVMTSYGQYYVDDNGKCVGVKNDNGGIIYRYIQYTLSNEYGNDDFERDVLMSN